jgi:hypothetical protein
MVRPFLSLYTEPYLMGVMLSGKTKMDALGKHFDALLKKENKGSDEL